MTFLLDLQTLCNVYFYADDNTLSFSHSNPRIIKEKLEQASTQAVKWFHVNFMKANPSKFQAICISRDNINIDFDIGGQLIKSETNIKLLGINIDNKLNFNYHVSVICKKAARQINALQRLCKYMDHTSRLRIYESFIS